eukprot:10929.XXX_221152_221343_1 [CDS] Oithona nana genome sequencing.
MDENRNNPAFDQRRRPAPPPGHDGIYLTLKPLIFFVFFSLVFMFVAVGLLLLAILIVQLMLDK